MSSSYISFNSSPPEHDYLNKALKKEYGSIFGFFIKNFRFTYLMLITILALGSFALLTLPREANPEIKVPFGVITSFYPGATPGDVEEQITNKIEDKVKNLDDLKNLDSTSGSGISSIFIEFNAAADLQNSFQKLREAVDRAKPELPADAEDPVVTEIRFNDFAIVTYSLVGDCSGQILKRCADKVKDALEDIPSVSKVEVVGQPDREYQIIVDSTKLVGFNLSLSQLIGAVSATNLTLPVGEVEVDGFNYNVRLKGKIFEASQLNDLVVANFNQSPIYLRDVATIIDSYQEETSESRIGLPGQPSHKAVSLLVFKKTGGNIIQIVETADEKIAQLAASGQLDPGVEIIKTNDNSLFIKEDLGILARSGLQTMVLIFILLMLALGFRSALITALSVPIAFLMSFIWLQAQGETLNGMVLFALVLSLGLMVDNSIVIIEGIVEYLGEKYDFDPLEASVLSVWNYKWPIIAGTLTTVSAFLPMLLVSGILGQYMGILPKTLTATLLSSLFVALIIIPTLAARRVKKDKVATFEHPKKFNFITKLINYLRPKYISFMQGFLPSKKKRRRAILIAWLLFILSLATMASGIMRVEMFPRTDIRYLQVNIELPIGQNLAATKVLTAQAEDIISKLPEVETYVTSIGLQTSFEGGSSSGSHLSSILINLVDKSERKQKSYQVGDGLRDDLALIKGADITVEEASAGPPTGAPIEVRLSGPELIYLANLADRISLILENIPDTLNVQSNLQDAAGEFVFNVDLERANFYGFNTATIGREVRTAIFGTTASTVTLDGEDVDIVVKYDEDKFNSINDIENILLVSPLGQSIPLKELATVSFEPSLLNITHREGQRVVKVTADLVEGGNLQAVLAAFDQELQVLPIADDYSVSVGGEVEDIDQSFREIFLSMIVAVFLIAAILILQFNSFKQPLIIILTVPLAIIGVVFGLNILRLPFSLPAFIGIVSLAGIVVNDAIVLVDKVNKNIAQGMEFISAIIDGGQSRMQPIFLTSATTIAGIFPLIFANELWEGLAWTVIWGLAFSTVLTLVMVPILYVSFCTGDKCESKSQTQ